MQEKMTQNTNNTPSMIVTEMDGKTRIREEYIAAYKRGGNIMSPVLAL